MIRYEIREICGDWAIYEVRPDAEGEYTESELVLILNSRSNAEYVKAILEHEAKGPNAAVPYRPEVAQMSDAECVAAFRFCCSDSYYCDECQFERMSGCGHMAICRRVLEIAEKYLEHENIISFHEKLKEITREAAGQTELSASAQWMIRQQETLHDKTGRLEGWISVDERLPEEEGYYLAYTQKGGITINGYYTLAQGIAPSFDYFVTHWMPLPEPPMMKGGEGR